MGDRCYPNVLLFTMYEFYRNLYWYYWNGLNPYQRIEIKFKPISADTLQGKYFLHNNLVINAVRKHKEFKCCFACHYPQNPIPALELFPNYKLYPFLKHILYVFHFARLIGCDLAVDEQISYSKVDMCIR